MPGRRSLHACCAVAGARFAVRLLAGATMALALATTGAQEEAVLRLVEPAPGQACLGDVMVRFEIAPGVSPDRIDIYVAGRLAGSVKAHPWTAKVVVPASPDGVEILGVAFRSQAIVGRASTRTQPVPYIEEVDVQRVLVYPVVVDRRGRYLGDLVKGEFRILDRGKDVPVRSFERDAGPVSATLLIDTSGSMSDKMALVKSACSRFVSQLQGDDTVAVLAFNHTLNSVAAASKDKQAAQAAIDGLSSGGGTALYDAVVRVARDLAGVPGRKALVVFSDGHDVRSLSTLEQALAAVRGADVIVYAVAIPAPDDPRRFREDLIALAEESGGSARTAERPRDLEGIYSGFLADLRAQYQLSFVPLPGPRGRRAMEVKVMRKGAEVRARRAYEVAR